MRLTTGVMNYSGSGNTISLPSAGEAKDDDCACKGGTKVCPCDSKEAPVAKTQPKKSSAPDFAKMSATEKLAYHRDRLKL